MKKYYGKEKCRILKQVRAEIAKTNGIEWAVEECPHKGDCKGTCPACEAEVLELEKKLEKKRKLGQKVIVAGVAAGISLTVTGCTPESNHPDVMSDVAYVDSESTAPVVTETETEGDIELIDPDDVLMGKMPYIPETEEDGKDPECDTGKDEDSISEIALMGDVAFYPDEESEEQ